MREREMEGVEDEEVDRHFQNSISNISLIHLILLASGTWLSSFLVLLGALI